MFEINCLDFFNCFLCFFNCLNFFYAGQGPNPAKAGWWPKGGGPNPEKVVFEAPGRSNKRRVPKFNEKIPREGRKERIFCGGRGKKRALAEIELAEVEIGRS